MDKKIEKSVYFSEEMEKTLDVRTLPSFINFQMIEPDVFKALDCNGLCHDLKIRRLPTDSDENELQIRLRNALDNLVPVHEDNDSEETLSDPETNLTEIQKDIEVITVDSEVVVLEKKKILMLKQYKK